MKIDSWLKLSSKDGLNLDLLKTRLTLPNPDYLTRVKMGFKTTEFEVHGKCEFCGKETRKTYGFSKDIPKACIHCKADIRYIIREVEMKRFDKVYTEVGNEMWVPRGLVSKYGENADIVDNTTLGDREIDFKSRIKLGPNKYSYIDQKLFVNDLTTAVQTNFGALGQSNPGTGKTIMALEVIARLKRPAAIIVHKEFLMNQWAERIMQSYDIKESEIGFVQQDVCDFQGKKIVLIMIQSLLARDYPQSLFDYFGTLCFDEVHRIAAQEFRKAIVLFPARYRIGVTATPRRKDQQENIFFWHIGDIAAVGKGQTLKAKVKFVNTKLQPTDREMRKMYDYRGKQNLNKVIDYLIENDSRNRLIVTLLKKALVSGRKVIILSGRLAHLERLKQLMDLEMVKDGLRFTSGYYIGGMKEEQRTISATRDLIYATFAMAEEGLDIPDLDTLFLVTPKSDIEQSVGRILREQQEKKQPVVIDFSDAVEICISMMKKRMLLYEKAGHINTVDK